MVGGGGGGADGEGGEGGAQMVDCTAQRWQLCALDGWAKLRADERRCSVEMTGQGVCGSLRQTCDSAVEGWRPSAL